MEPAGHLPAGYLRLQHARSPYVIEVSTALLGRLLADIVKGQEHGFEIGGLLTGSFPKAAVLTLRIDNFVPVERRSGDDRLYILSPEQRARLSTLRHKLIDQQTSVLGFFRSHLRKEPLALTADDRELLTTEFRKAIHVALLIRADTPHRTAFVVSDSEGNLQTGPPIPELQFDADHIARLAIPRKQLDEHSTDPGREIAREDTAVSAKLPLGGPATWVAGASTILLILLCLSFTAWGSATARLLSGSKGLGLAVTNQAGVIEVRWNPRQRDLEQTHTATLSIEDSGIEHRLALTPVQIRFGAVAYQPHGHDVRFTFTIPLANSAELVQRAEWSAP
jgi:hypothetical protein